MLYLVNSELKGQYPVPPARWMDLVVEMLEAVTAHKQQGKLLLHGALVGRHGGIMVWDVDSHAELQALLTQLPLWPFLECEIIPILSTEETLESAKRARAAMQG